MLFLTSLTLLACTGGDDVTLEDDSNTLATGEVTYYADVRPMLDKHCVRCHIEGGLGLGDFTNQAVVEGMAERMLTRVDAGTMPPPASDPDCRDYAGSDYLNVDDEERQVLADWIEGGLPLGAPADDPGVEAPATDVVDPDVVVQIDGYTPTYEDAANPGNEYRCFVLDPELTETRYVTEMAPIVDAAAIVHHVVLITAKRAQIQEEHLGEDGYDCIDGTGGIGDQMVGAWAPGMLPVTLPDGYGMPVGPDDVMVLQMHYFQSGDDTVGLTDATGYAFKTVDDVDTEVVLAPIGIYDFEIPANAESHTDGETFLNEYPVSLELRATFPHMHVLGTEYDMRVQHADGTETCLATGTYDFDNQMTYQWNEPVELKPGDSIDFSCTWNNSESNLELEGQPQTTFYGERTDEEMCFFFTFVNIK